MKKILMWTLGICSAFSLASCNQSASQVQQPIEVTAPAAPTAPAAAERPTKDNPNGWTEVGPGVWEKTEGEGVQAITLTFVDGSVESLEWTIQQDEAALSKGLAAQALDAEQVKRSQENLELHRELLRKVQESEPTSLTPQALDSCTGTPRANVRFETSKTAYMVGYATSICQKTTNPLATAVATAQGREWRDNGRPMAVRSGYGTMASVNPTLYTLAEWPNPQKDCIRARASDSRVSGYLQAAWGTAKANRMACL